MQTLCEVPYLGYGHKILFLQSFESSASYALLTLRPDGQYQAEFNLDPDLDATENSFPFATAAKKLLNDGFIRCPFRR